MQGRRILLADDEPGVHKALMRAATKQGCEIVSTIIGADVKWRAVEAQPDVIVLDLTFPDADGRDILAQLKADPRTTNIPVLIWSGRSPETERLVALELGAEDYVEKSDVETLLTKVRRLLLRLDSE